MQTVEMTGHLPYHPAEMKRLRVKLKRSKGDTLACKVISHFPDDEDEHEDHEDEHEGDQHGCCVETKNMEGYKEDYCYGDLNHCPDGVFRDCRTTEWMNIPHCDNGYMFFEAHWREDCPFDCHGDAHDE